MIGDEALKELEKRASKDIKSLLKERAQLVDIAEAVGEYTKILTHFTPESDPEPLAKCWESLYKTLKTWRDTKQ